MEDHHKIIFFDGKIEVHLGGPEQGDAALCGHDLAGDCGLGWETAEPTKDKVTCPHCIAIVKYCKKVKLTHIKG